MKIAFRLIQSDTHLDYFFKKKDGEYCLRLKQMPHEDGTVDIHTWLLNLSTEETIKDEKEISFIISNLLYSASETLLELKGKGINSED